MHGGQHAISRAALRGKATVAHLGDHHWRGVGDTMAHARLLKGGCDGPNLATGAGELCRDLFHNGQTGGGYAVVIGDENAQRGAPACNRSLRNFARICACLKGFGGDVNHEMHENAERCQEGNRSASVISVAMAWDASNRASSLAGRI